MPPADLTFAPSPDVRLLLNTLLNRLERRAVTASGVSAETRPVKILLKEIELPGYYSQIDPEPRQVTNEQIRALEQAGLLHSFWEPGEKGHLLAAVALIPSAEIPLYDLIGRIPAASLRARLQSQLLGERFRFTTEDWQFFAIQNILAKLKENQSPAPFTLVDPVFNEDLLSVLANVSLLEEETPFRLFSVHIFNDSKRFEDLKSALIRLARLSHPDWRRLPKDELLRELNLVANPSYLLFSGAWMLVDTAGQILPLGEFSPSIGLSAVQAMHLVRVNVHADKVICIENLTTFHSLAGDGRIQNTAMLCLAGNPSPACRRILYCLAAYAPENLPLYVWADLDYGGFNILAQLRKEVSQRFLPYHMDADTLDQFAQFARPLTLVDKRNLERLTNHTMLKDVRPVIQYMLKRGLKLEQEAITL